ncbi:MAG: MFS transporter [Asgard group archaeon]|nr:MFS transporter [Asgard group archaeon]
MTRDTEEELDVSDESLIISEESDSSLQVNEDTCLPERDQLDTKGNKKAIFWLVSIFSSTGQFFFGNFFSAFAVDAQIRKSLVGFITSIRNLLSSISQGTIGFLSDKIGRKFLILLGIFMNFLVTLPLLFTNNTWAIIIVAIVQAFSLSIFMPAWNAVLGDVTKPEFRATFIGKITAVGRLISVSFSIIAAIVFYLADVYSGRVILGWTVNLPVQTQYAIVFGIAAFNSLLCSIFILMMKETRTENLETKHPKMRIAFKDRNFMKFTIFYSLFGLSMSFMWPINPVIQVDILSMEVYQIAIISSVFILVMSIVQIIAGKLGDKIGRRPIFILGAFILVLYPVSSIPALITNNWLWQILSNTIAGLGTGTFFVALAALTLDLAPGELMGAYSGIREMFWGIATFIGSLSAGFILDAIETRVGKENLTSPTIYMCIGITIFRLITAIGFLFVAESYPKEQRELNNNRKNNC